MTRLETRSFESPDSSNIKRVEWTGNPDGEGLEGAGELRVQFVNGGTYRYAQVPIIVFEELRRAESVGQVFHRLVRTGPFEATKLEAAAEPELVHYDGLPHVRAACTGAGGLKLTSHADAVTCPACQTLMLPAMTAEERAAMLPEAIE